MRQANRHDIKRLAYLGTPDKVRAGLLNSLGYAAPLSVIEGVLDAVKATGQITDVGEPCEHDALVFAPRAVPFRSFSAEPPVREKAALDPAEVEAVRRIAGTITDKHFEALKSKSARVAAARRFSFSRKLTFEVCEGLKIDYLDFRSNQKCRARSYVHARGLIAKLLREKDPKRYSFPNIARLVGKRDHTTVIHNIRQFDVYCRQEPRLFPLYKALGGADATP